MIRRFNRSANIFLYITIILMSSIVGAEKHEPAAQAEWHQWRGANRDGISPETGILKAWPEAGPKELWRLPLGDGFSGISVANGRAYTMFAKGEDEVVVCLDAETGKELWRYLDDWFYAERQGGNGPRSTPTIDGDTVYVLSAFGRFVALNANTGEERWNHDFTKAFSSSMPRWGFSTSPVIEDDRLLIEVGGANDNTIVAFNKGTGERIWGVATSPSSYSPQFL